MVTVHQPSAHLPLETGINLQRALIIVYPGPDCCVLRALQALSHSLLRTIWRFFLLPLGNKRLCKLPKVRELLSGSARIQNQFRLTLEFALLLDVLYSLSSSAPPTIGPRPVGLRTGWLSSLSQNPSSSPVCASPPWPFLLIHLARLTQHDYPGMFCRQASLAWGPGKNRPIGQSV